MCPSGSYAQEFGSKSCTLCPEGKWTFSAGSRRITDCTPCHGSISCTSGASVRITVGIVRLNLDGLSAGVVSDLEEAYANDIVSALGLDKDALKDLTGKVHSTTMTESTVAGSAGVKINAFTNVPDGSSAQTLANRLYTDVFRSTVVQTSLRVLGEHGMANAVLGHVHAPMVEVHPEQFHPVKPTTTTTKTTEALTTTTTTTISTITATVQHDLPAETTAAFLSTKSDTQDDTAKSGGQGILERKRQLMLVLGLISFLFV